MKLSPVTTVTHYSLELSASELSNLFNELERISISMNSRSYEYLLCLRTEIYKTLHG